MATTSRRLVQAAVVLGAAIVAWLILGVDRSAPEVHLPTGIDTRPAPIAQAVATPAPATSRPDTAALPTVVLGGVVAGSDHDNLAIASVDRGPQVLLRVGDSIGGTATVVRIDHDSMTYRSGGNEVRVFVRPAPSAVATATPNPPVKTYPGFVAAAPAIARANGAEPGSGNEAFRQAFETKMQAIAARR